MKTPAPEPDESEIEASRAPLLDHLTELRTRLIWMVVTLLIAFVGCFSFAKPLYIFLIEPFQLAAAEVAIRLKRPLPESVDFQFTDAFNFFFTQMRVALFAAIIVSFPMIAYQAYAFIAPGLYKKERRAVLPFLITSPLMFFAGCGFVYFIALPYALDFALSQELDVKGVSVKFIPKVDEYLNLVTTLVLAFGFVFQMPVVMGLLGRMGVVSVAMLRKGRRYAIVAIAAFSALVTPPDPLSMVVMTIPVYLLYELSIWIVWLMEKTRPKEDASPAAAQPAE